MLNEAQTAFYNTYIKSCNNCTSISHDHILKIQKCLTDLHTTQEHKRRTLTNLFTKNVQDMHCQ